MTVCWIAASVLMLSPSCVLLPVNVRCGEGTNRRRLLLIGVSLFISLPLKQDMSELVEFFKVTMKLACSFGVSYA